MTPMITDDLLGHIGIGGAVVWLLEIAKRSSFGPLKSFDTKAAWHLNWIIATLATLGLQIQYDGTLWDMLMHGGHFTGDFQGLGVFLDNGIRLVGQLTTQKAIYHGLVKPLAPATTPTPAPTA